jgi:hypothetical protein
MKSGLVRSAVKCPDVVQQVINKVQTLAGNDTTGDD